MFAYAAVTLQFMLPDIPSIYYGDEIGMQGYEDPLNRLPMRWDDVDEELLAYYRRLAQKGRCTDLRSRAI